MFEGKPSGQNLRDGDQTLLSLSLLVQLPTTRSEKPKFNLDRVAFGLSSISYGEVLTWWFKHIGNGGLNINYVRDNSATDQVPPRFELWSLNSKSRVLTITPWNHVFRLYWTEDMCAMKKWTSWVLQPSSSAGMLWYIWPCPLNIMEEEDLSSTRR